MRKWNAENADQSKKNAARNVTPMLDAGIWSLMGRARLWRGIAINAANLCQHLKREAPMQCKKTGAIVYSDEYHEWFYGDLYMLRGGIWILKTAGEPTRERFSQIRHATFHEIAARWLELKPYGVLVSTSATYHGYKGVPT